MVDGRRNCKLQGRGTSSGSMIGGVCRVVLLSLIAGAEPAAAGPSWPPEMVEDADLHAVFFVSSQIGWAAGDRGGIWKTTDAGASWVRQATPTGDSLRGLFFHDATHGWAVGGRVLPYVHQSAGTLLTTTDGGATWMEVPHAALPALHCITFRNSRQGLVAGDGSPNYPSGAFQTEDGGRSWKPISARSSTVWTAADTNRSDRSLLLGRDGSIAVHHGPAGAVGQTPQLPGGCAMRDIRWISETAAMAVGDQGRVWLSSDGGRRWQDVSARLPVGVAGQFDFHTIAAAAGEIWIAGYPGTLIFHSRDLGESWTARAGPGLRPVHRLDFTGADAGWAVGPLGTIFSSANGGRAWQPQRNHDHQLASLGISADADAVPWEFWAHGSSALGLRSRLVLLTRETWARRQAGAHHRLQAAALAAGGCGGEVWPELAALPSAGRAGWQDRPAAERTGPPRMGPMAGERLRLEERITRALRVWQPPVLVIPSPRQAGAAGQLIHDAVRSSLRGLRSDAYCADQWRTARLPSWPAERALPRVYLVCSAAEAEFSVQGAEWAPALGMHVDELARISHALLQPQPAARGSGVALARLDRQPPLSSADAPWADSSLAEGSPARRAVTVALTGDWRRFQHQAQQQAALERLLSLRQKGGLPIGAWTAQLDNLAASHGPEAGPWMLFHLAHASLQYGLPEAALAALESLTRQFPQHDLQLAAVRTAAGWAASTELRSMAGASAASAEADSPSGTRAGLSEEPSAMRAPAIDPVAATQDGRQLPLDRQLQVGPMHGLQAAQFSASASAPSEEAAASQLWTTKFWTERAHPLLGLPESVAFLQEADRRQRFQPGKLQRPAYQRLLRTTPSAEWQRCAAAELALLDGQQPTEQAIYVCQAGERPKLDGRLEEPIWLNAQRAVLSPSPSSPSGAPASLADAPAAEVRLAQDHGFLYIGIVCDRLPLATYSARDGVRTRDMRLDGEDRVEIYLDVNRDYTTAWQLVVDHRGCTRDACHGSLCWNPEWYVAAASRPHDAAVADAWCIEAAVSLKDLAPAASAADAWVLALRRQLPDGRRQIWPHGAVVPSRLQTAGLLLRPPQPTPAAP